MWATYHGTRVISGDGSMVSRISLPNGLTVWAPNAFEAAVVYREVFTESTYESHGIVLRDNATVFDVGANVGLFSIRMATAYTGASVFAFEPIPAIFAALSRNLAEHAPRVRAFNVGLSDRAGEATFEVDRFMTIGSTMHPRVFDGGPCASSARWASAAIADFTKVKPNGPLRLIADGLARPITRPIVLAALAPIAVLLALRRSIFLQRPRCRLDTLSAMLVATGVGAVDLVKIDVEGAEEQVLDGVDERDWPRLRQLVIEVHDVDGRLARMTRRLEMLGYAVTHAREDWALHEILGIWTLYAVRNGN